MLLKIFPANNQIINGGTHDNTERLSVSWGYSDKDFT